MKGLPHKLIKLAVCLWLSGLHFCVFAEVSEIIATGYAAIADDKISARKIALEDAKRQAVEQGLGLFIESKTTSENFVLSKDEIFTRTTGRLSGYKIIKEEIDKDDDTIAITISAKLSAKKAHKHIQDVISQLGLSRLPNLNISVDAEGEAEKYVGKIKSALSRKVKKQGFTVKSSRETVNAGGFTVQVSLKLDEEATEYQGIKITNTSANVEITATRLVDSMVLATEAGSYQKAGISAQKAVKGYINKELNTAWKSIQEQLLAHWYEEQQSGRSIIIKIEDPKSESVTKLVQTLKSEVFGISDTKLIKVDAEYGVIEVMYYGWPEQLYTQLTKTKTLQQSYQLKALKNDEIVMQLSNQS